MHDSNPDTARDLASVLIDLRNRLSKLGLTEGTHYEFVKTRAEVFDVMRRKTRFHYGPPDVVVEDTSGGN
jgi:Fe2+ transport system protein FeoA